MSQKKLYADTIILPRDLNPWEKKRLKVLEDNKAEVIELTKADRSVLLSVQRHVVVPEMGMPKGTPSLRQQLEDIFKLSTFTIYVDRKETDPVRVAVSLSDKASDLMGRSKKKRPFYMTGQETLDMFPAAGFPVEPSKDPERIGFSTLALLTETTKMGCYSFNLPAGPPSQLGTCPASDLGFMYNTVEKMESTQANMLDKSVKIDPVRFVCNGCYALKHSYGNVTNITGMAAKRHVVMALMKNEGVPLDQRKPIPRFRSVSAENYSRILKEARAYYRKLAKETGERGLSSPSGGYILAWAEEYAPEVFEPVTFSFSELMTFAITETNLNTSIRRAKLQHFGYTRNEMSPEGDYPKAERIMEFLTHRKEGRNLMKEIDLATSKQEKDRAEAALERHLKETGLTMKDILAKKSKYTNVYWDWQVPDPKYFRIHDAGDFYSDNYFRAWLRVIKNHPQVNFWAPTRVWAFKGSLSLESLKLIPENLAMRPSGLHFRELAPTRDKLKGLGLPIYKDGKGGGLCAGTGAAPEQMTKKDWRCPAYDHWTVGGGAIRKVIQLKQDGGEKENIKTFGGTCATAQGPNKENGCRACWTYFDTTVVYSEH